MRSALREEGMRLEKQQTITMNRKQKRVAVVLIRGRCANFYQGYCLPLDTQCPQADSDSLLCRWFREAVLPLDEGVQVQLTSDTASKHCVLCGRLFRAMSNRAKYCVECAAAHAKKQRAAWARKNRTERGCSVEN